MRTVQLAIHDSAYARCIRDLLLRDQTCNAVVVDTPDPHVDGVILLERNAFEALPKPLAEPDRFVVIAGKEGDGLARIWNAGIHHVVFEGDSPNTVQLAIIAAQLRSSHPVHAIANQHRLEPSPVRVG
jgi:hypothetical protein